VRHLGQLSPALSDPEVCPVRILSMVIERANQVIDIEMVGTPANPSEITTGGLPAGATVIGVGRVSIDGTLTQAAAYKPA
jgi:hypothetical protein